MSFFAIAQGALAAFSIFQGIKGIKESKKQTKLTSQGNEEVRKARVEENNRRKISERQSRLANRRQGIIARAKAVGRSTAMGQSGSISGFGGSIISTTSGNLKTINQFAELDQTIFTHAQNATIFDSRVNKSQAKMNELQSIGKLAETGLSITDLSIWEAFK